MNILKWIFSSRKYEGGIIPDDSFQFRENFIELFEELRYHGLRISDIQIDTGELVDAKSWFALQASELPNGSPVVRVIVEKKWYRLASDTLLSMLLNEAKKEETGTFLLVDANGKPLSKTEAANFLDKHKQKSIPLRTSGDPLKPKNSPTLPPQCYCTDEAAARCWECGYTHYCTNKRNE